MNHMHVMSDHLNRVETSVIVWLHEAHPTMPCGPEIQRKLNMMLADGDMSNHVTLDTFNRASSKQRNKPGDRLKHITASHSTIICIKTIAEAADTANKGCKLH